MSMTDHFLLSSSSFLSFLRLEIGHNGGYVGHPTRDSKKVGGSTLCSKLERNLHFEETTIVIYLRMILLDGKRNDGYDWGRLIKER